MLSKISNNQCSFQAYVPDTAAKLACDRMAKNFTESGEFFRCQLAQKYKQSIWLLENNKRINEVLIMSADHNKQKYLPGVLCDGDMYYIAPNGSAPMDLEDSERLTYILMEKIVEVVNKLTGLID